MILASQTDIPEAQKTVGRYPQVEYYFYPENVVALHAAVKEKGYAVTDLKVRFYGLKEFEMLDPDGHLLLFGQDTDEPMTPE